jgi:EAL domain-containing protein (putative c-di-GMP-specific phosphodiesterase class I)
MQTHSLKTHALGVPRLEARASGEGDPEQTWIMSCPFWIGRSDLADLQLSSTRVSRMHAKVVQAGAGFRIQDSGSTNGTLLNGSKVNDAPLSDGDVIQIADVEFTFRFAPQDAPGSRVTEVNPALTQDYSFDESAPEEAPDSGQLIADVRRLHEIMARCSLDNLFQPIVGLADRTTYCQEAVGAAFWLGTEEEGVESLVKRSPFGLTQRMRALLRVMAVEQLVATSCEGRVFVSLLAEELVRESIVRELAAMCRSITEAKKLVVALPACAPEGFCEFRQLYRRLKDLGVTLAYNDSASDTSTIRKLADTPAELFKLSPLVIRGIDRAPGQQKQVRGIAQTCAEIGCQVIASGIKSAEEAATCLDLGCQYGQGDHFQHPRAWDCGEAVSDAG